MQPISTEEVVAYLTKKLSSDRAQTIEDLSESDAEVRARLWLIHVTAAYCLEDMISTKRPAAEVSSMETPRPPSSTSGKEPEDSAASGSSVDSRALETVIDAKLGAGNLERAQKLAAAYRETAPQLWSRASSSSITALIGRVKQGDRTAAHELYARYFPRLQGLVRARLQGKRLHPADEEDVAQSALLGFFSGVQRGQYTKVHDVDDLWHLLFKITIRKAQKLVKEQESQKRRSGTEQQGEPSLGPAETSRKNEEIKQVADPQPAPDVEVLASETIERLLERLKGTQLRSIAVWKWEGHTTEEIATKLGCSTRTIQRKLKLIRTIWSEEDRSDSSQAS